MLPRKSNTSSQQNLAENLKFCRTESAIRYNGTNNFTTYIDEETLTIIIEDTAPLFDRTQKVPPDNLDLPLDEQEIGGLRVYLVITRS